MNRRLLLALLAAPLAAGPLRAAAAEEKKKKTGGDSYIQIDMLTAYTIKPSGRRGVLTVDCGLDIPDATLRQRAELLLPRLRAAYIQLLQVYAGGLPSGATPSPDYLGRSLQRTTDQILGRPGARLLLGGVLLT